MEKAIILKKLIENTGLSFRQFSINAGIPYTTLLSMLDRGVGKASVDNVIKICRELGITIEELESSANTEADDYEPETLAAHASEEEWSPEEQEDIENFKAYLRSKRNNN